MTTPADEMRALAARCETATQGGDVALVIAVSGACDMQTPHGDPTTSLDAAMTLVPEGWTWAVYGIGYARLIHSVTRANDQHCYAATPALALCAAALRARAAMEDHND